MRFWYVDKRREHVFDYTSMIMIVVVLAALLVWLFPQQTMYRKKLPSSQIDAVSIAYLEVLQQSAPHDHSLRINLIDQLIQTGQFNKALRSLEELRAQEVDGLQQVVSMLHLRVLAQLVYAGVDSLADEPPYPQQLDRLMKQMAMLHQSPEDRRHLIDIALALGKTAQAAEQYVKLAAALPERREEYLRAAARWYLASGKHAAVAETYIRLADRTDAEQKSRYFQKAIDNYLMIADSDSALALYERFLKYSPADGPFTLAAAKLALSQNNIALANRYLSTLVQLRMDDAELMLEVQNLALAIGNTELAQQAGEHYAALVGDNWHQRRALARLYEWNGRPEAALSQWRDVNREAPTEDNTGNMMRLAVGLYQHDVAIEELEQVGWQRRLSNQELRTLANSYEESARPSQGAAYLQAYLQRQPAHREAWVVTAFLLERNELLEAAIYTWGRVEQRFGLSVEESQRAASLMWALNDPESALAVLLNSQPKAGATHRDYWRMLATLAWQGGESELAIAALSHLIKGGVELSSAEADIVLWVQDGNNQELQLRVASNSWYRFGKPHYLLAYMQLLYNMQRWPALDKAMAVAEARKDLFASNAHYWLLKASVHTHKGAAGDARAAYVTALELTGNDVFAVSDFMWFLINSRAQDELRYFLPMWQTLAEEQLGLWPIYAAANTLLGDYQQALRWYSRLAEQRPGDQNTLMAYADTLALAGRKNEAWRLRRYLLQGIQQNLFQPATVAVNSTAEFRVQQREQQLYRKHRLVNALHSYREQQRQLTGSRSRLADTAWLPMFTDRLIAGGESDAGAHWQLWSRRYRQEELPVFQRVSLVYSSYDRDEMQALMQRREQLLPSMQAHLLDRLGEGGQALAAGMEQLSPELIESQQEELRELLTQRGNERPSGVRIEWQLDDLGDVELSGPALRIAQATDDWYFRLDARELDWQANGLLDKVMPDTESVLELSLRRELMHGQWQLDLLHSQREDASVDGARLHFRREWDSSLTTTLETAWQDLPGYTPLLRAYASYDHFDLQAEYLINARNTLRLEFAGNRFSSRDGGEKFATGYYGAANWFHRLNFEDPEWSLQAGVEWMNNSLDEVLPAQLQHTLAASGLERDSLLPQEYGQVYIGSTWQHGDLHSLNSRVPTPRYLFNTSLSYQWPRDEVGVGLELGLGWRVWGNDELALSYRYNSSALGAGGKAAQDLRLSYSYRFGR